jgi:hypothetical protein
VQAFNTGVAKMPKVIDGVEYYTKDEVDQTVSGLKATNQQLKDEKKELQSKFDAIEAEKRQAEEDAARKAGDYEKLNQLMAKNQADQQARYEQLMGQIKREKVANAINDLVNELGAGGKHNEDLRDLIAVRYQIDFDNEKGNLIVMGDGVTDIESLKKSIKESGRYDAYLAGTKASGGGATGKAGVGSKKISELTEQERVDLYRTNPDEFKRLQSQG